MKTVGCHALLLSVAALGLFSIIETTDAFQSPLSNKNGIPSVWSRRTFSPSTTATATTSTSTSTTQLSAAMPKLNNWKLLPGGQITGIIKGHPSIPDGEQVTTSVLEESAYASSQAVVKTKSGIQYKLLAQFNPNTIPLKRTRVIPEKGKIPSDSTRDTTRNVEWEDETEGAELMPILGGALLALGAAIAILGAADTDKITTIGQVANIQQAIQPQAASYLAEPAANGVELPYLEEKIKAAEEKISVSATNQEAVARKQKAAAEKKEATERKEAAEKKEAAERKAAAEQKAASEASAKRRELIAKTKQKAPVAAPASSSTSSSGLSGVFGASALFVGGGAVGGGVVLFAATGAKEEEDEESVLSTSSLKNDGGSNAKPLENDSNSDGNINAMEAEGSDVSAPPLNDDSDSSNINAKKAEESVMSTPSLNNNSDSSNIKGASAGSGGASSYLDALNTSTPSAPKQSNPRRLESSSNKPSTFDTPAIVVNSAPKAAPTRMSSDLLYGPPKTQAAPQPKTNMPPVRSTAAVEEVTPPVSTGASDMRTVSGANIDSKKSPDIPVGSAPKPFPSSNDSLYGPPKTQAPPPPKSSRAPVVEEIPTSPPISSGASPSEVRTGSNTGAVKSMESPVESTNTPITPMNDSLYAPPKTQAGPKSQSSSTPVGSAAVESTPPVSSGASNLEALYGPSSGSVKSSDFPVESSQIPVSSANSSLYAQPTTQGTSQSTRSGADEAVPPARKGASNFEAPTGSDTPYSPYGSANTPVAASNDSLYGQRKPQATSQSTGSNSAPVRSLTSIDEFPPPTSRRATNFGAPTGSDPGTASRSSSPFGSGNQPVAASNESLYGPPQSQAAYQSSRSSPPMRSESAPPINRRGSNLEPPARSDSAFVNSSAPPPGRVRSESSPPINRGGSNLEPPARSDSAFVNSSTPPPGSSPPVVTDSVDKRVSEDPAVARIRSAYAEWCQYFGKAMAEDRFATFSLNYVRAEGYSKDTGTPLVLNEYADLFSQSTGNSAPVDEVPPPTSTRATNLEAPAGPEPGSVGSSSSPYANADTPVAASNDLPNGPPQPQAASQSSSSGAPVAANSVDTGISDDARIRSAYAEWCQYFGKPMEGSAYAIFSSNYVRAEEISKDTGTPLMLNEYADLYSQSTSNPAPGGSVGSVQDLPPSTQRPATNLGAPTGSGSGRVTSPDGLVTSSDGRVTSSDGLVTSSSVQELPPPAQRAATNLGAPTGSNSGSPYGGTNQPLVSSSDSPYPPPQQQTGPQPLVTSSDSPYPPSQQQTAPQPLVSSSDSPYPPSQQQTGPQSLVSSSDLPYPPSQQQTGPQSLVSSSDLPYPPSQQQTGPQSLVSSSDLPYPPSQQQTGPQSLVSSSDLPYPPQGASEAPPNSNLEPPPPGAPSSFAGFQQDTTYGPPTPKTLSKDKKDRIGAAYAQWCEHFGKSVDQGRMKTFSSNYIRAEAAPGREDPLKRLMKNQFADMYTVG